MADKIFPANKPTAVKTTTSAANHPSATTKPQLYNAARPVYRSHPHRNRRSCYCYCCLWIIFILLLLIIISAIAAAVLFLLYRPHRPSFSVSAVQTSQLNLTSSNQLTTRFNFNLTVVARNPNKKIVIYYDPVSVLVRSKGMVIGDGSIPAFVAAKKNTSALKAVVRGEIAGLNADLKSDLKQNKGLLLKIEMNAKVKVKIASYKSKKALIRVVCNGVQAAGGSATVSKTECEVDLRIKIWKWTL